MYTYSFFILFTEFHVASTQIKFCQICPHQKEGSMTVQRSTTLHDREPSEGTLDTHIAHQMT
jgi:hypothetical protein